MHIFSSLLFPLALSSTALARPNLVTGGQATNLWIVDLYRARGTCETGVAGDIQRVASIEDAESTCHKVLLPVTNEFSTPGAQGAKLTTLNKDYKVTLFDDTGCTDPSPGVVTDDGTIGCEPGSSTGAGWMSFMVEKL